MSETLSAILEWLLPGGFATIGAGFLWLTNRNIRMLKQTKETHDTYKIMYDDLSESVKEILAADKILREELSLFKAMTSESQRCRYRRKCPVNAMRQKLSEGFDFLAESEDDLIYGVETEVPP